SAGTGYYRSSNRLVRKSVAPTSLRTTWDRRAMRNPESSRAMGQTMVAPVLLDGVLNIRKERGCTSHDVVVRLRQLLGGAKVGHAGTLDPEATGVLPVLIGKATRVGEY